MTSATLTGKGKSNKKRKAPSSSSSALTTEQPSKKHKKPAQSTSAYRNITANALPWQSVRNVKYDFDAFDGEGGMLDLEEIDGVDVVFEQTEQGGRNVRFKVGLLFIL